MYQFSASSTFSVFFVQEATATNTRRAPKRNLKDFFIRENFLSLKKSAPSSLGALLSL
jgi:hypothetical protein